MKRLIILPLLLSLFSANSFAESSLIATPHPSTEELNLDQVRLLGRGIEDKETHETLGIACVNEQTDQTAVCDQLRYFYFNPKTQKAFYLGPLIQVKQILDIDRYQSMTPEARTAYTLRRMMKNFNSWRRGHAGASHQARNAIKLTTYLGSIGVLLGLSIAGASSAAVAGGFIFIPFFFLITPLLSGDLKVMQDKHTVSYATHDQSGWNWNLTPAPVKSKIFNQLYTFATQSDPDEKAFRTEMEQP